tara:strand:+ start:1359 stop:2105 length:747 start_codon:yes stop_codon:yes gene_type:complete
MANQILNIAHRGSRIRSPENTLSSFQQAINEGADYLELDVRLTGDGHVVVAHDARLNRTSNGSGRVRRQDLEQLKTLDFGEWFHEDFKNETMPTLEEVLDTFPSTGLNIEIKAPGMESQLVTLLDNYKERKNLIISSFFLNILKRVQDLNANLPLGLVISQRFGWRRKMRRCKELGFFSVHMEQRLVNDETMLSASTYGLKMIPWTSRILSDQRVLELIELGIYGFINDFPEQLPRVYANYSSEKKSN